MEQYINKSAIAAEIEKIIAYETESIKHFEHRKNVSEVQRSNARMSVLMYLRDFLNTIEVKDVDLEKEIQDHIKECLDVKFPTTNIELIKKDVAYTAKKFFELGLKVKEEVTTTDAFINKACEWLRNNMYEGTCEQMLSKKPYPFMSDFIDEFKQAMKGE